MPPPAGQHVGGYGPGGESAAHRLLKLYVAGHPLEFGLSSAAVAHVEYPFATGDRVDVMFENHMPDRTVVEVEVEGEREVCIGIHQAIKYRSLAAADAGYPVWTSRVRPRWSPTPPSTQRPVNSPTATTSRLYPLTAKRCWTEHGSHARVVNLPTGNRHRHPAKVPGIRHGGTRSERPASFWTPFRKRTSSGVSLLAARAVRCHPGQGLRARNRR